jgi:hypothetical protein
MFDGTIEIRRSSNNMVITTRWEDDKLLTLKGISVQANNYAHISHYDEGTLSSSLVYPWETQQTTFS